mgnify:CR=1 FL=1
MKSKDLNGSKKQVLSSGATWAELYNILYELLERRQHLLPYAREFNLIDGTLKDYFSGVPSCSIGEYKVSGRRLQSAADITGGAAKMKDTKREKQWVVEIHKQNTI